MHSKAATCFVFWVELEKMAVKKKSYLEDSKRVWNSEAHKV